MFESMLHIRLNTGQMASESADGGLSGDSAALLGDTSESVREQGRRGFGGTRQGDGS